MNKVYSRINWQNSPSDNTPLNESNLNRMDYALDQVDDRVIALNTTKVETAAIQNNVADWTMDETTGVITITKVSGEKIIFDLNIEKIPVSFVLSDDGILTMTTSDGTKFTANIASMIPVIEFEDSDAITVSKEENGKFKASVKNNSITDEMIEANYLANIRVESAKAESCASSSSASSVLAESYTHGGTGTREREDSDNAKYYMEQAKAAAGGDYVSHSEVGVTVASLIDGKVPESQLPENLGTKDYDELENKPSINGHVLTGNQSTSDLGIIIPSALSDLSEDATHRVVTDTEKEMWSAKSDFDGDYNSLSNKPTIPSPPSLATTSTAGIVKPDGTTITVGENGVISSVGGGGGSSSDWELIGSVTGNDYVEVDTTKYKEFYVLQGKLSYLLLSSTFKVTQSHMQNGCYQNASSTLSGYIYYSTVGITNKNYYINGSDCVASTTMTVYGRK